MDSDDEPLVKTNGVKSQARISPSADKSSGKKPTTNGHAHVEPGISIRSGPVDDMEVDSPTTNGAGKRKARLSNGANYKDASSEDEDIPLSKKRKMSTSKKPRIESDSDADDIPLAKNHKAKMPPKASAAQIGQDEDSDVPLGKQLANKKAKIEQRAAKEAKALRAADAKAKTPKKVKQEDSDDDVPLSKKPLSKTSSAKKEAKPLKKQAASPSKKPKSKASKQEIADEDAEIDAEEEEYRWWENVNPTGDGTRKWTTLEHNGVVFPPPYEPLPKNVKFVYNGKPVKLKPEAEEVATFYGSMLNSSVNVENPKFNSNFFKAFKDTIKESGGATDMEGNKVKIDDFEKCNFRPIFEHFDADRAAKKALPAAEKKAAKAQKDEAEASYMYCMWDGRKQKVGNFRVEPPGLFRGRGDHPKTGFVKKRVTPEQITINIGQNATVPAPPEGHKWKAIKHDHEGTWLAMWQENINNAYKYVMLAANSDIKGQSDYKKFEKARELKKHIDRIRVDYQKGLKAGMMADRQRATAMYLIDQFALRAGNEKSDDEADTVGCCSLKYQHVTLKPPKTVIFDFLGKDSIRFHQEVEVDQQVFRNLQIFKKAPKGEDDEIFDRLTTSGLNKHLSSYMNGLTAKVFRTYNASFTMSNLLQEMKSHGTIAEKVKDYNDANREVAILCNHKRTVAAGHEGQMEKMEDKINGLRYQQWRLKQMMLDVDGKLKKRKGAEYFELPEGIDQNWVHTHQEALVEEQREKIKKKFQKDNEKRVADGEREMKQKDLDERLDAAKELAEKFKKENKKGKVEAEGKSPSVEKYDEQIQKLDQRIETMRVQAEDKNANKEVALGTSKINYIDPRLTVVFSKKFDVPIERTFSKTLREKFDWAIKSVDENWTF